MSTAISQNLLESLRPGDRLRYKGIDWDVKDYSSYQDPNGYDTEEWLLESTSGSECYLLREYDPNLTTNSINWYIARELFQVRLYVPNESDDIVPRLWQEMRSQTPPYPELKHLQKSFYFESQTQGDYETGGIVKPRTTWDYWDKDHQINLAIEAFADGKLDIYSTKVVQREDFSQIQKQVGSDANNISRTLQIIVASFLVIIGIFMIIFG